MYANIENLTLATGTGNIFGSGNDLGNHMLGNEGANLLLGWGGADTIEGAAGNDILYGLAEADSLLGGAGLDYLIGGDGADTLDGGTEADVLYGEAGNDLLHGGSGFFADILYGGAGDDTLDGSAAPGTGPRNAQERDFLDGGLGNDSYYIDSPADLTFERPEEGIDTVYVDCPVAGYYILANIENLVLLGTTPFGVGNALDNGITGSASGNWLYGGAGRDTINGKAGNDVLWGQADADTFIFERGTGIDTVGDFTLGVDKIQLAGLGFTSFAQVLAATTQVGAACAINLGAGDALILNNLLRTGLAEGDFLFA